MTMPKTGFGAWKIVKDWTIKKISRWCYCGSGGHYDSPANRQRKYNEKEGRMIIQIIYSHINVKHVNGGR